MTWICKIILFCLASFMTDFILWISFGILQLDFDDGSPPEYAWRRKLSSHANRLKEFNVTFREAIKMVQEMQLSAFPVHGNSGCDCSSFCWNLKIIWLCMSTWLSCVSSWLLDETWSAPLVIYSGRSFSWKGNMLILCHTTNYTV